MNANPERRFSAIILAAGMSRRMGRPKPLLDFGGSPLIVRIIESLQASSINAITVVTGHEPELIRKSTEEFDVNFVQNQQYESGGMISSVQAGVGAVDKSCSAFFVVLGDHSPSEAATLAAIIEIWIDSQPAIVLPTYRGKHGHPILISSKLAPEILALTFDQTLASIVKTHARDSRDVAVDDPAILEDIDTPDDYNRALSRWSERHRHGNRSTSHE